MNHLVDFDRERLKANVLRGIAMKVLFKHFINKKELSSFLKWLLKEIIAGLMVAAAIAISTLWISNFQAHKEEQLRLEKLHLGLSSQYIDSVFGIPMVKYYDPLYCSDIAIYKEPNCVVWCAYKEQETVAYIVIVKSSGKLYRIDSNIKLPKDAYLTQFTYSDFSDTVENFDINVPANNDDYAYYSEIYYGAGPADYNYFILGSYKSYFNKDDFAELLGCQWAKSPETQIMGLRNHVAPNAFGMIQSGYEDVFSLVPMGENLRTYNDALFGDWYD